VYVPSAVWFTNDARSEPSNIAAPVVEIAVPSMRCHGVVVVNRDAIVDDVVASAARYVPERPAVAAAVWHFVSMPVIPTSPEVARNAIRPCATTGPTGTA